MSIFIIFLKLVKKGNPEDDSPLNHTKSSLKNSRDDIFLLILSFSLKLRHQHINLIMLQYDLHLRLSSKKSSYKSSVVIVLADKGDINSNAVKEERVESSIDSNQELSTHVGKVKVIFGSNSNSYQYNVILVIGHTMQGML